MKNILIGALALFTVFQANAKHLSGYVYAQDKKKNIPLEGAAILELGQPNGTTTDGNGFFEIELNVNTTQIVVSYVSFVSDTIDITKKEAIEIVLQPIAGNLGVVELNKRRRTYGIRTLDPRTTLHLREQEFQKAACCNLSESFENAPAIDVSFTDAVTGTKQIKMLGLDGVYTSISREFMPSVRGLNAYYGLSFIPAAWVEGIQITKGAGSVVNGFESMSGQINIEMKKPYGRDQFMFDQFVSESGRSETDIMVRRDLSKHVATSLFGRFGIRPNEMDRNNDGFMDNPTSTQYQLMNRWQFHGDNGVEGQLNVSYNKDEKTAGQFGPERLNPYNVLIDNEQFDVWAKLGKAFKDKPYKSLGSQYAFNTISSKTVYGNDSVQKVLATKGQTAYVNLMYQSIIGNTNHGYKAGISFIADWVEESFDTFIVDRQEMVPGAYFEYTMKPDSLWILVSGARLDYSNLFGFFPTFRFHGKRNSKDEKTALRFSIGNGRRTPNFFAQNQNLMISSKPVVLNTKANETVGIIQESSINMGVSIQQKFKISYIPSELQLDFFRTTFYNELLTNREGSTLVLESLKNGTIANSAQAQLDLKPARRTELRLAYRLFDVTSVYNGNRVVKPLISRHRGFVNVTQSNRSKWQFSSTLQIYGPQRVPGLDFAAENFDAQYSPVFPMLNAQISKRFKKKPVEFYVGVENLLNYKQSNPILGAANPFGSNFDATSVWGPVFGRMIYGGFRYRVKIEEKK
ncbi:MAG: carboxypeptidase-like regulatory domain-containing protein [Bacteroidetes bacterium]|jgi:outer membrane receptor for ferrienterochelin and colicins|nr:carboxypeptidase-like regulatory domain-containing protein [Bacteroidota bacterium]